MKATIAILAALHRRDPTGEGQHLVLAEREKIHGQATAAAIERVALTKTFAPVIMQQIGKTIRTLKEHGFTIHLVEQNFRFASTVADRYYIMEHGRVVDRFANAELDATSKSFTSISAYDAALIYRPRHREENP